MKVPRTSPLNAPLDSGEGGGDVHVRNTSSLEALGKPHYIAGEFPKLGKISKLVSALTNCRIHD